MWQSAFYSLTIFIYLHLCKTGQISYYFIISSKYYQQMTHFCRSFSWTPPNELGVQVCVHLDQSRGITAPRRPGSGWGRSCFSRSFAQGSPAANSFFSFSVESLIGFEAKCSFVQISPAGWARGRPYILWH